MKTTTLKEIIKHYPSIAGLEKLLEGLNFPTKKELLAEDQLNAEISIRFILENNGIKDALWAMCVFAGSPDWYRLKADIAELALSIFEEECPLDKRPRLAIQAARDFADGKINVEELKAARLHANHVAYFLAGAVIVDTAYAATYATYPCNESVLSTARRVVTAWFKDAKDECGAYAAWDVIEDRLLNYI